MTRTRLLVGLLATGAILGPLAWMWQGSRMPGTYSALDMGHVDRGGAAPMDHGGHESVSVADLTGPAKGRPDVVAELSAEQDGDLYSLNGTSPGPTIEATVGDLVEVRLTNTSVKDGVSLHWHGIDVPNAEDGVAGVTQDAVMPGEEHVYRFVVPDAGTYWYHSHQMSHRQVVKGLFGAFVVHPKQRGAVTETLAVAHTYSGVKTLNGSVEDAIVDAEPGSQVRVRVVNTDNGALAVWNSGPFRVAALDGRDLHGPTPVRDQWLSVPAGGRADLLVTAPARVRVGSATAVVVGDDSAPSVKRPAEELDLLTYGTAQATELATAKPDRTFAYSIGRRPGFVDGRPGLHWSINGRLWPDVPMFHVAEGDVVRFRIENHSGEAHPMHLHGHHALVLSRNGTKVTGSPWWVDSLDVADGEEFEIAFVADNPGLWMDHCHNLPHAAEGLVAHLMYEGVTTPFRLGRDSGNEPE